MATIFTRIIAGEIPARFVWKDDTAVAFLDVAPIQPGHTLVVPRLEEDHWIDLPPHVAAHLMRVARVVGRAQHKVFQRQRVALVVAGMAVPHAHLHVYPIDREDQMRFELADRNPDPQALDDAAAELRQALEDMGHPEASA